MFKWRNSDLICTGKMAVVGRVFFFFLKEIIDYKGTAKGRIVVRSVYKLKQYISALSGFFLQCVSTP